jgi:hypothetical protein
MDSQSFEWTVRLHLSNIMIKLRGECGHREKEAFPQARHGRVLYTYLALVRTCYDDQSSMCQRRLISDDVGKLSEDWGEDETVHLEGSMLADSALVAHSGSRYNGVCHKAVELLQDVQYH